MIRQTLTIQGDTDKADSRWTGLENRTNSPRLIKMDLNEGSTGTVVTLFIDDLTLGKCIPKIAFNALIVDTKLGEYQGLTTLVATVPPHRETRCSTMMVPIYLYLYEGDSVITTWHLTDFSYEGTMQLDSLDQMKPLSSAPPPLMTSPPTSPQTTVTTTTTSASQPMISPPYHDDFYHSMTLAPSMASLSTSLPGNNYSNLSVQDVVSNGNDKYQPNFRQQASSTADLPYSNDDPDFPTSTSGFTGLFDEHLDQNTTPTMSLSYPLRANVIQQYKPTISIPTTTTNNYIDHRHHRPSSNPKSRSFGTLKASGYQSSVSVASYQPYPDIIGRSNLVIEGDMKSMTENWCPEEWECFRRLVCFRHEKVNNDIKCNFQQIIPRGMLQVNGKADRQNITPTHLAKEAAEEKSQQQQQTQTQQNAMDASGTTTTSTVVSCIYWPEKRDWFITSVDCIRLLEHLLDLRFSVEEKNRVRRNLEGFCPLTVGKTKSNSADFFKLIMSFPNPKPRNIEKDLKVFRWKTLPYALKKIITKYTATSYDTRTITNHNGCANTTVTQQNPIRHRYSYQDMPPTPLHTTLSLSSGTTTATIASNIPQLPTLSSSSSSPSSSTSLSTLYHRRASAPTNSFNNSNNYQPFFPVTSAASLTDQPSSFSSSSALSNSDTTTRRPSYTTLMSYPL